MVSFEPYRSNTSNGTTATLPLPPVDTPTHPLYTYIAFWYFFLDFFHSFSLSFVSRSILAFMDSNLHHPNRIDLIYRMVPLPPRHCHSLFHYRTFYFDFFLYFSQSFPSPVSRSILALPHSNLDHSHRIDLLYRMAPLPPCHCHSSPSGALPTQGALAELFLASPHHPPRSPSVQLCIGADGSPVEMSTHEQVVDGHKLGGGGRGCGSGRVGVVSLDRGDQRGSNGVNFNPVVAVLRAVWPGKKMCFDKQTKRIRLRKKRISIDCGRGCGSVTLEVIPFDRGDQCGLNSEIFVVAVAELREG
jgi:hypothetical protein